MNNENNNIIPSNTKMSKTDQNKNNKVFFLNEKERQAEKLREEKKKLQDNLKAKIKDRYRIKGAYFSDSKTEKKIFHKKHREGLLSTNEINFKLSMEDYEKLKHDIYLREKNRKNIESEEKTDKIKIKEEINYTNLKEILYQFMRSKNKANIYQVLKKNKLALENANRNITKNRINAALKKAVLHCSKVEGKIDNGSNVKEEYANEITLKNLLKRISISREKFQNKKNKENGSNPNHRKSKIFIAHNEKTYDDFIFHSNRNKRYNSNKSFIRKNKTNIFMSNKYTKNDMWTITENKKILKLNNNVEENENDNNLLLDVNNFNFSNNDNGIITTFYSHSNKNLNSSNNMLKSMSTNINIINSGKRKSPKNNKKLNTTNKTIEKNKNSQSYSPKSKYRTQNSLKDILRIRKNFFQKHGENAESNIIFKKRNSKFWNKNYGKRVKTASFRKINNKVSNKPLYTTKITDLVKNFKRIKSATKMTKNNLRENHITTFKQIDDVVSIREEMLMFFVKDKYFKFKLHEQKIKPKNNKKIFLTKFRNYIEMIDNPYNFVLEDIEDS